MSLPKLSIPTFELTLPSSGQTVKYRPFLVKEHKVLMMLSKADDKEVGRIICELVDVCTFKKLDVKNLPHFDVEYIFMKLRSKSVSEMVDALINCNCGNKIRVSFNLEDLNVVKVPEHQNKFMITDTIGIEMKYPNFEDIVNLLDESNDEVTLDVAIKSIKGIYNSENYWEASEQSKDELSEFVNSLNKEQFEKVEKFFVTSPKIRQTVEADCPSCKKHNVAKLEGIYNFFI